MKFKLISFIIIVITLAYLIQCADAQPTISSSNNSKTDDRYPKINISESITFSINNSGGNCNFHNWTVDGTVMQTNTSTNYSVYVTSFSTKGVKNVSVVLNNLTTPSMFTWVVLVKTAKTTGSNTFEDVNVTPLDDMMDAMDEQDYNKFLFGTASVFTNSVGAFFYLFILGTPLLMMWITQEKKEIPAVLTIMFGGLFTMFIPGSFVKFIVLFIVFAITGALYLRFKERGY